MYLKTERLLIMSGLKKILSPSILSADFKKLGEELETIDKAGAEYVHVDVMDGLFVKSISFGMPVIKSARSATDKVFDVHLMIEEPIRYIEDFVKAGADIITVHVEACKDVVATLEKIKECGVKAAITLNPPTPVSAIEPYLDKVDMVLVMSVNPGFGGQKFIPESLDKVKEIRSLRKDISLSTDVIVGFPGETEEEFAQTKEYLKRIHFYEMHIFKYSRRQGTRAAVMEHQVPEEIKTKRSAQLLALAESMSREFRAYYVGKEEEVLFEEPMEVDGETWYTGYTKEYVKIAAKTAEPLDNVMKRGRVEAALTDEIYRMKL